MTEDFRKIEKVALPAEEKEPEIEIDPQFLTKLKLISRIIGGDFNMKVEVGKANKPSMFIPEQNRIVLNPLDVKKSPTRAMSIAAHEGEHRAISRSPQQMGVKAEKIREFYSKIGFKNTENVLEDLAADSWGMVRYPGVEPLHKEFYDEEFKAIAQGGSFGTPEASWAMQQLGYKPKFVQYGEEAARKWHKGEFSEGVDPKVESALKKTIGQAEKYRQNTPAPKQRKEQEIIEKARSRFSILTGSIWPEVEKLANEDFGDEKLRQMLSSIPKETLEQLSQETREELEEQMDKARKEKEDFVQQEKDNLEKEIENLEKEIKELQEKQEGAAEEAKEGLEKEIQERELQKEQKQKELQELEEQFREAQEQFGLPVPMDRLPESIKKELRRIFENLDEEQKQEIKKKSREILEELEDKVAKGLEGKLNEEHSPSHREIREAETKKENEQREKEEIERARRELAELMEELKSEYDKYYEKVVDLVDELSGKLEKVFLPQRRPRWKKGFSSGTRIDLLKAMQFDAARQQGVPSVEHRKMFERKTMPEKRDYKFMFLVDMSGSMRDGVPSKIEETFKGLILLSEVLNRLNIDFAVYGYAPEFPDNIKPFKTFEQEFTEDIRSKLPQVLKAEGKNTPTGSATKVVSQILEENRGKENFLVTMTDGRPNLSLDTHEVIGEIKEKTDQKLIGLGLGPGTKFVEGFYAAAQGDITVEQLSETLAQLLEDMILYPQKYK